MDKELHVLLDLDGENFWINEKYWVKFSARKVNPNEQKPHGIAYSLTLHNALNERIIGFDNAHGVRKEKR